jgi:sporulation protein YlmC with PRC-barrel domain
MRLSDLLNTEVVDERGRSAGRVQDLRLIQDGPVLGGFGAAFRAAGLIVGTGGFGARLGYDRREVKGPWPVKALVGRLLRDARYVPWERIRSIEPDRIVISGSIDDLSAPGSRGEV